MWYYKSNAWYTKLGISFLHIFDLTSTSVETNWYMTVLSAWLTFDAKRRALWRLAHSCKCIKFEMSPERLNQPYRSCALSFTQRSWSDSTLNKTLLLCTNIKFSNPIHAYKMWMWFSSPSITLDKDRENKLPSNNHIFAIRLSLQSINCFQLDFGLGPAIELNLIRKETNLLSKTLDGFRHTGARDGNITAWRRQTN